MAQKKYASLSTLSTLVDNIKNLFATKSDLNTGLSGKADKSHKHSISDTTNLQSTLDGKVPTTRTINNKPLSANITLSASDVGAAPSSVQTSLNTVSDTLNAHTENDDIHFSATERTKLSGIAAGAQVNTITGVKGNSESSYRTGNVNITKANIGLGNVDNTADANKTVKHAATADSATSATKATQDASGNTITSTYETKANSESKLATAKQYTDTAISNLINSAPTTLDTLGEIATAMQENEDVVEALETSIGTKANASDLTSHANNKSNPHGVTLAQLGVTATVTELNKLDGVTATTAELNILDGVTATATELSYMDGVTSNVQAQLDQLDSDKAEKIHIHPYGVCSTDGATAAKTVTVSDFALTTGVRVVVKFTTTNTASSPTLNVNGTGAKNIYYRGSKIYTSYLAANKVYEFVYDGSYWVLVGDNTTGLMTTSNPTGTGTISINRKAETTSGTKSAAIGNNTTASGNFSVALGDRTTASAQSAFAEGSYTTASGVTSHAEGDYTTASADASHAEGNSTEASGFASHSEGNSTVASGTTAHAEGYITDATGEYSHSEGYYTKASSDYQHVQGSYNIEDTDGKYLHIVGNGRDDGDSVTLSNAHTIDWDGNGWFQGDVYVGGESQDDYGVSKLMKETDYEWNLIYNSGSITAKANSISGIDISGYKRIMVAVSCVNDGTNISKSGSVIFTGENGKTYQFPCWTNMFSTTANAISAGIAQFDIIYGYIVCPSALRSIRTSNFLTAGEGGTADNLTSTGGGIMRCTSDLTTLAVSSLDQDTNCNFGVGSRVMVWGCKI